MNTIAIIMNSTDFTSAVYEMIFSGSLKKGGTWGGNECTNNVTYETHYFEAITWLFVCVSMYFVFNLPRQYHEIKNKPIRSNQNHIYDILDKIVAFVLLGLWFQVLYYKIQLKSLVNLLQPCHLSLLGQGFAILSDSSLSTLLSLGTLPFTIGAIGAIAVPATEGLDQPFEKISFFIHITFYW